MPNANASTLAPRSARVVRAAIFVGVLAAAVFLLGAADVPCGFARVFHVPCPGCGSTRAMLALLRGDIHGLVRYNPLAPFMSAMLAALCLQALSSVLATGTFRRVGNGTIGGIVALGMVTVAALEVLLWFARFGGFLGGPVPV